MRELADNRELIAELEVESLKVVGHLDHRFPAFVGSHIAVVDVHHVRRLNEGVIEILILSVERVVDLEFALLDDTYNEHSDSIVILGVYPWVDTLRSDSRFPKLLQRIGLQP